LVHGSRLMVVDLVLLHYNIDVTYSSATVLQPVCGLLFTLMGQFYSGLLYVEHFCLFCFHLSFYQHFGSILSGTLILQCFDAVSGIWPITVFATTSPSSSFLETSLTLSNLG